MALSGAPDEITVLVTDTATSITLEIYSEPVPEGRIINSDVFRGELAVSSASPERARETFDSLAEYYHTTPQPTIYPNNLEATA